MPLIVNNVINVAKYQNELAWQSFRPGIDVFPIQGEPGQASACALLRYHAGAILPEHTHKGCEYILVLSGSQQDEHGQHIQGTLTINTPDSKHNVSSPEGCIVLAIWQDDIQLT
ncbi:MAG TPA: cupin domain-containing protein [Pseudomonadales bacterium]|nr:cupin domain-containing protein [Pseudomonadales bacterium]